MGNKILKFFFCLFFALLSLPIFGDIKGSEIAVSVELPFTFPAIPILDNEILGFAWFRDGFSLADSSTECIYNAIFPISGDVDLKGGTLILSRDLRFDNITNLIGLGTIKGNNYSIDFASSVTCLPANTDVFENTTLFFHADVTVINTDMTFKGNCLIDGFGNGLILGNNAEVIVDSNAVLEFRNMEIEGIAGNKIKCKDNSARIILDSVRFVLSGDYTFSLGSFTFIDQVDLMGSYTFAYESCYASTVKANSTFQTLDDIQFNLGLALHTERVTPIYFEDRSAVMRFNNCHVVVADSGVELTRGTVMLDRRVTFDISSTNTGNGIVVGDGTLLGDLITQYNAGSFVQILSGHVTFNNASPNIVEAAGHVSSRFVRGENTFLRLENDLIFPNLSVEVTSNLATPNDLAPGKIVFFQNSLIVLPDAAFNLTGFQINPLAYSLNGNDSIFFNRGKILLGLLINNSGNKIQGPGSLAGPITFLSPLGELTLDISGLLDTSLTLNGGKLIFAGDLELGVGGSIIGPGTIDLNGDTLITSARDLSWTTPCQIEGTDGAISLNATLSLKNTVTCNGSIIIDGNNNDLDLKNGTIVVDSNSHVTLKDINIKGISNNSIKLTDDSSSLTLDNVIWSQSDNFTFDAGSINALNQVDICGSHTFVYDSNRTFTIESNSELHIQSRTQFSIGRKSPNAYEPLVFTDNTSVLRVDNCTLNVTQNGATFTKGVMVAERDLLFEIDSTSTTNGLNLGNGNASEDITFELSPGCSIRFNTGHIIVDLDANDKIRSQSKTARLFREAGTEFVIKNNLTLSKLTLEADPTAILTVAGSLSYDDCRISTSKGTFDINGARAAFGLNSLSGNQTIFLGRGILEFYTLVNGTGNKIQGNGSTEGSITFGAPTAELTYGIDGLTINNITLNGGKLMLDHNLNFAKDALIQVGGTVNIGKFNVNFGPGNLTWTAPITWDSTGGAINLDSRIALSSAWTFSGTNIVDGHNNILDLGTTGELIIEKGSSLKLKNIQLTGAKNTNVRCLDKFAKLILDNARWVQDNDSLYLFTQGSLDIQNDVILQGEKATFAYQSDQDLTILSDSQLKLDENFTFSYDPISNLSKKLLVFEDSTSFLTLKDSNVHTNLTGLELITGNLLIKGDSCIAAQKQISDDLIINEGITIGDGTVINDCLIIVDVGSTLVIADGTFIYNNIGVNSVIMRNNLSSIKVLLGATLDLRQTLTLGDGRLLLSAQGFLKRGEGVKIKGSLFITE